MHKPTAVDAFNMLCGAKLGEGVYRNVYECKLRPELVVKVEINNDNGYRSFQNVHEMKFWEDSIHVKAINSWLAPCKYLSPDALILLQVRVRPCLESDLAKLPKQLPTFLTDTKYGNFGFLPNGKLVCCDYAMTVDNPSTKLRKAQWW